VGTGVIKGYTAIVDDRCVGGIEAFIEVRMPAAVDAEQFMELAHGIPQILEVYNVA
jgi:Lrp/AsnC family leucine-responsive transcriptional regulator